MFIKTHFSIIVISAIGALFALTVYGQQLSITFPIPELGNCQDKTNCQLFCSKSENIDNCTTFGREHGLLSSQEADQNHAILEIQKEGGPGGCKSEVACRKYCNDPGHAQECFSFAQQRGLISGGEAQRATKMIELMQTGQTPGGCKTQKTCMAYCTQVDNVDECTAFGLQNGLITQQEADNFKKTHGSGPDGCVGQACQDFCSNQTNQKTCFEYARQHHLISDRQVQQIEESSRLNKENFKRMPDEIQSCIKGQYGDDVFDKIGNNEFEFDQGFSGFVNQCFQAYQDKQAQNKIEQNIGNQLSPNASASDNQDETTPEAAPPQSQLHNPVDEEHSHFRHQLEQMPAGVIQCAQTQYGDDFLDQIENGTLRANQDLGNVINKCLSQLNNKNFLRPSLRPSPEQKNNGSIDKEQNNQENNNQDNQNNGEENTTTETPTETPPSLPSLLPSPTSSVPIVPTFSPPPSPAPSPSYSMSPSPNPATSCSQYGGTWNGSICIMPSASPAPHTTYNIQGLLQALINFFFGK